MKPAFAGFLIALAFSDGTTPTAVFHYDEGSALTVGLSNTVGRLSSQESLAPGSGAVLNGEVDSYLR